MGVHLWWFCSFAVYFSSLHVSLVPWLRKLFLSDLLYSICRLISSPEMDWNVFFFHLANYWDTANSKLQALYENHFRSCRQKVSFGLIGWILRPIGKVCFWHLFQTSKPEHCVPQYCLAQADWRGELSQFTRCALVKTFPDIYLDFRGLKVYSVKPQLSCHLLKLFLVLWPSMDDIWTWAQKICCRKWVACHKSYKIVLKKKNHCEQYSNQRLLTYGCISSNENILDGIISGTFPQKSGWHIWDIYIYIYGISGFKIELCWV